MNKEIINIEGILHTVILKHAYPQYVNGHLRGAVLDAFIAVFDLIRERTGLELDGAELAGRAFSLSDPMLIVSELDTESGRSDQKGFIQLLQGAYSGVRNPKAHTLHGELENLSTAQYLVLASLLARRVEAAALGNILRFDGIYVDHARNSDGTKECLRFYDDGTVLKIRGSYIRDNLDLNALQLIMSNMRKDRFEKFDFPRGTYTRTTNIIKFSTKGEEDEVEYDGIIRLGRLDCDIHDVFHGYYGGSIFIFHKVSLPPGFGT